MLKRTSRESCGLIRYYAQILPFFESRHVKRNAFIFRLWQALHGCHQLLFCDVWFISRKSETPVFSYFGHSSHESKKIALERSAEKALCLNQYGLNKKGCSCDAIERNKNKRWHLFNRNGAKEKSFSRIVIWNSVTLSRND